MWTSSHAETGQYHFPRLVLLPHKHRIFVERRRCPTVSLPRFMRHFLSVQLSNTISHRLRLQEKNHLPIQPRCSPWGPHDMCFGFTQTRCDGKKRTADAIVYSYFAAVASLLDPTLLALSLNWKLPHQPLNERPPLFAATKLNKRQNNQNKPSIHTVIDSLTPFFVALLELLQHAEQPFRPLLNPYSLSCKAEWKTIA